MKKSILIVHTENASRKKHFAKAREYDANLILLKANPTWETEYVDEVIEVDTRDVNKCVNAIEKYKDKIDGVVTFVEHSVPTAAAIAKYLNLPFITEETACLSRNKYEMRLAFKEAGIQCPKFDIVRTIKDACLVAKKFSYPVVVKPLIGGGSMFVRKINNEQEMINNFETLQKGAWDGFAYDPLYKETLEKYSGAVLIESYIEGSEVSIESIVVDNITHPILIHDKPLPMCGPFFEEVYFATPSRINKEIQEEIKRINELANKALCINIGATHTEFRISSEGPIILETAARMGGGPVYRNILTSTGFDMVHSVMDLSLSKKIDTQKKKNIPTGFVCFFAQEEGVIKSIEGVEDAFKCDGVVEVEIYKNVGDLALRAPNTFQAHGHAITTANTLEELDEKILKLTKLIKIKTK